jgi:quinohemoprotein ethanol dehydrogenase
VLDRDTGKLISAEKATHVTWAKSIDLNTGRPIEEPNIRYETGDTKIWPGTVGGHNWQAMSFSPDTGLVYIPMQQIGAHFYRGEQTANAFNVMGLMLEPVVEAPGDGKGSLIAWDPVAQQARWTVQHEHLWNGGTLATAGNLVFQGEADGKFVAYDARNGTQLWHFNAGLGIISAPMSFSRNNKQYVSVLVGYGGTTAAYGKFMDAGWKYGRQPRRLLTFALGGKATLPITPGPDFTVKALDNPDLVINEADVAAGRGLFIQCAACHGVGLQATGTPGPDLRESALAVNLEVFRTILKEGPLMERGMPRFEMLSDDQIRQLHSYIRAVARETLGKRAPSDSKAPMPKL